MLVGFDFGAAAANSFGALAAAGAAVHEMWSDDHRHCSGPRPRAHELQGPPRSLKHRRHQPRSPTKRSPTGAGYALVFIGFLSLVLAVINLLPFLPLDGGHVALGGGREAAWRRRVSLAAMWRFSSVGIVLLLFLVINGLSATTSAGSGGIGASRGRTAGRSSVPSAAPTGHGSAM